MALACGTVVEVEGVDDHRVPRLPSGVAPSVPGCSEPRLVPAGKAWLVSNVGVASDGSLLTRQCPAEWDEIARAPVQRFSIDDVFVDTMEATNECYAACVAAGACGEPLPLSIDPAWDDPARSEYAVQITPETAEQFCSWRGGRLPTLLELTRTSHGDRLHIGQPALYERFRSCLMAPTPECSEFTDWHMQGALPVGSIPDDVGPFGHHDLFGGVIEASATVVVGTPHIWPPCEYEQDARDPGTFGTNWVARAYFGARLDVGVEPGFAGTVSIGLSDGSPGYGRGVRCAYDPVYLEPGESPEAP